MAHVIGNTNHPCYGMDCKECETCIFDVDLFVEKDKMKERCNDCASLIKNYIGDDRIQYNACCSRCMVNYINFTRPRTIQFKTGPMLDISTPAWCPKRRGVTKEYKSYAEINSVLCLPEVPEQGNKEEIVKVEKKPMTYMEKKEALLKLPKRTEWEDIKEGDVYVIPKILSQSRKVVRIVVKTDSLIRCSEIDEFGKESQICSSIYPKDIESVFITKIHKY